MTEGGAKDSARLALRFENGRTVVLPAPGGHFVLGRGSQCNVVLDDGESSTEHCRLEITESGVKVVDLNSTNGTLLNGARISESMAHEGDVIGIGGAIARIVPASPSASTGDMAAEGSGAKRIPPVRVVTIACGAIVVLLLIVAGISELPGGDDEFAGTAELIEKGKAAYERRDWDAVITSFTQVPPGHPEEAVAQRYTHNARVEKENEKSLRNLELYLESKDYEYAMQELVVISSGSVYENQAVDAVERQGEQLCGEMRSVLVERLVAGEEGLASRYGEALERVGCGTAEALLRVAQKEADEKAGDATSEEDEEAEKPAAKSSSGSSPRVTTSRPTSTRPRSSSKSKGSAPQEAKDLHQKGKETLQMGSDLLAIEQLREARRLCKEADVSPSDSTLRAVSEDLASAYVSHGRASMANGDLRRARLDYTHAYHFDRTNQDARAGLMDLKSQCNEAYQSGYVYETGHHLEDRAAKFYKQAMDICPDIDGFGLDKRQEAEQRLANLDGGSR